MGETRLAMTSPVRKYASGFSDLKTGFMLLANVVKKGRLLLLALRLPCQYPAKMRIAVSPTARQYIYSDFYTRLCPRNSRIGIVSLTLGVFLLLVGGCGQKEE